jgi:hypothetical protein
MRYSPEDLRQGMNLREQAQETPSSFGTLDGAVDYTEGKQPKSRMAGKMGARIADLMNNPQEIARTQQWMQQFGMSNEGYQFNQARMMMANPQPPQEGQA